MTDSERPPGLAQRPLDTSTTDDDIAIGGRIAHHRRRHGLSQRELAQRLGRSTAWVSGIERGRYHLDRLPLLTTLATVLDVEVTDLVPDRAAWLPESNEMAEDPTGLVAGLSTYRWLGAAFGDLPDPVDVAQVEQRLDQLELLIEAADYEAVARALTEIVPLAEAAAIPLWPSAAAAVSPETKRAFLLVCRSYGLAGRVLFRLGHFAAAWLATDRSITAAGRAADQAALTAAVLRMARLFLLDGRHEQAERAAGSVVGGLEAVIARGDADEVHRALAGTAHLMLAELAATSWNRGLAEERLAEAEKLAAQLPGTVSAHGFVFGPEAVDLLRVVVAVELRDAGAAVHQARDLDRRPLSPRWRARLLLHWARAEILRKAPDRALRLLVEADRLDPDQTANFPAAWSAIKDLGAMAARIHDRGDLAALQARVRHR